MRKLMRTLFNLNLKLKFNLIYSTKSNGEMQEQELNGITKKLGQ